MLRSSAARLDNNISNNGLFPWLRKKESSWSLRSFSKMNRFNSISTVSLPLSVVSSESTISSIVPTEQEEEESLQEQDNKEEKEEEEEKEAPPSYDDISHPWTFQFPKSLSNRVILPREEEGKETLPDYECTVEKMSYVKVKCEFSKPEIKSKCRSWKYFYIQICGTKVMAFVQSPIKNRKRKVEPVWTHSMHGAEATIATDYFKERHVIRLRIENGPQFLMTTQTEKEKNEWIATMESSINISSDLDERSMPQFITLISRRRRRNQNTTGGNRQLTAAEQRDSPLL